MKPDEYVGDPELEAEWLTSLILKGILLPAEYTNLRINVAGLQFLDVSGNLDAYLEVLKKKLVDAFGILKDKPLEEYYYGDNPDLYSGMQIISQEVDRLIELYGLAVREKFLETADKISNASQTLDYGVIGHTINTTALDTQHMHQMDQTQLKLRYMKGIVGAIVRAYGVGSFKIPKKSKLDVGVNTQYKLFLQNLSTHLGDVSSNVKLAYTLGCSLDSIFSLMPKDDNLDPYINDVCTNFLEIIRDPKSFYSKCKNDDIISPAIGHLFAHSYPSFYDKFQDMFMDDLGGMDYQEVLDFRKCFGLEPDDSQLSALCSQYITLGFKHA